MRGSLCEVEHSRPRPLTFHPGHLCQPQEAAPHGALQPRRLPPLYKQCWFTWGLCWATEPLYPPPALEQRSPSPDLFNISSARGRVATFCIFKTIYKIGEDVVGTFSFSEGDTPCLQVRGGGGYPGVMQTEERGAHLC